MLFVSLNKNITFSLNSVPSPVVSIKVLLLVVELGEKKNKYIYKRERMCAHSWIINQPSDGAISIISIDK